jgi:hypothetical protein
MKTARVILLAVVGLLLFADICWRIWAWNTNAEIRAFTKQFKIEVLHTNDMSGIEIYEVKTQQPLWLELTQDGKPVMENYFFNGKDVFNIALSSNRPPRYSVWFHEPDKSVTWWLDRGGSGSFTERIFYDTNGVFLRQEVLYSNTWYTVDRGNEKGIFVNGQWRHFALDTDGLWTPELKTNQ